MRHLRDPVQLLRLEEGLYSILPADNLMTEPRCEAATVIAGLRLNDLLPDVLPQGYLGPYLAIVCRHDDLRTVCTHQPPTRDQKAAKATAEKWKRVCRCFSTCT